MAITLRIVFVVAATVAAALAARAVLSRVLPWSRIASTGPAADMVMEAVASLYGVLVAFLLAGAWQRYDDSRVTLTLEAAAIANLKQIAQFLPPAVAAELTENVIAYQDRVMPRPTPPTHELARASAPEILDRMWRALARFEPRTETESTLQALAFEQVRQLGDQHRIFLESAHHLPNVVWVVLIAGATVTLLLVAIIGRDPLSAIYLSLLAAIISLALFSIYALSFPVRAGLVGR